ncbi:MAG: hypothetical protein ACJ8GW_05305 [Massilia sp.]
MKIRSRLKHGAAGLLARFISRNNDYQGFWAPGLLYSYVRVEPWRVEFDLISGKASPNNTVAASVATDQASFLRAALLKQNFDWQTLKRATLTVQFNAGVAIEHSATNMGEPFVCSVELESVAGHSTKVSVTGRCAAWQAGVFSGRAGALSPQL